MSTRQFMHEIFARATGLRPSGALVETIAEISAGEHCFPLVKITLSDRHLRKELPTIAIFAGTHGNEPAGVHAALDFAARRAWPLLARYRFEIFPCLNPWGYEHDTHHNPQHTDIDQNFFSSTFCAEAKVIQRQLNKLTIPYHAAFDLHEDNLQALDLGRTAAGLPQAYCVLECLADGQARLPESQCLLGHPMLEAAQAHGFPACTQACAYGYQTERGLIIKSRHQLQQDPALSNSLSALLAKGSCSHVLNCATPASLPFQERLSAHVHALCAALQKLEQIDQSMPEPMAQAA